MQSLGAVKTKAAINTIKNRGLRERRSAYIYSVLLCRSRTKTSVYSDNKLKGRYKINKKM